MTPLQQTIQLLEQADTIAIFAGAGMSVDSGLEQFRGANGLWEKSLKIDGKEIKHLDLMTHQAFEEMPKEAWTFIAYLIDKYNDAEPHIGYKKLFDLVKNKEYFVITSNIDEQFQKANFNEDNILEIHGSIFYMQSMDILEKEIWITPKLKYDKKDFKLKSPIPRCLVGKHYCRPNIMMFGDWFWVSTKSAHQQIRFNKWTKHIKKTCKNVVALEIGAGETIRTIRASSERFSGDNIPLIRVNPMDFEVNQKHCISIPMGAKEFLENL